MTSQASGTAISLPFEPIVTRRFALKATVAMVALCAVTAAAVFTGRTLGERLAEGGHTASTEETIHFIGNDGLKLPANAVRFASQRIDGVKASVDLYLQWPEMAGFSPERRDAFNGGTGSKSVIFLTLTERDGEAPMAERYRTVYEPMMRRDKVQAPEGLAEYRFTASSGLSGERMLVEEKPASNSGGFVAACLSDFDASSDMTTTPCQSDIAVGEDVKVLYRFSQDLLPDWKALEESVRKYVDEALIVSDLQRSMSRIAMEKLKERSPSSSSRKTTPRNSSPM